MTDAEWQAIVDYYQRRVNELELKLLQIELEVNRAKQANAEEDEARIAKAAAEAERLEKSGEALTAAEFAEQQVEVQ